LFDAFVIDQNLVDRLAIGPDERGLGAGCVFESCRGVDADRPFALLHSEEFSFLDQIAGDFTVGGMNEGAHPLVVHEVS
jgi:hypothetical protein